MIRHLAVAATVAYLALVAATLGLNSALDIHWDPAAAVIEALCAVWLGQSLLIAHLLTRRPR